MIFSVLLLVAAWMVLFPARAAYDEELAYRAAVDCASPASRHDDDCLRTVKVRFDRTDGEQVMKNKTTYWLYVTEADGTVARARLRGKPESLPFSGPGALLKATYWRGEIRYVDIGSVRKYAEADVRGDYKPLLALGLGVGFFGAGFLGLGVVSTTRLARTAARPSPWKGGLVVLFTLGLAVLGALAPWPTDGIGAAFGFVGLGVPVVLVACAIAAPVMRRRLSPDRTVAVATLVPTKERHFPGRVHGDVPYAGSGATLVVAPDGSLASTPDPAGVAYRREVPSSLTPLRVRPATWTAPSGDFYGGPGLLILECEDDGVPVYVITRRAHMSLLLGVLQARGAC